ncbi:MMPL family transporter [uncultured Nocardioides sp.]|uniref:MMPL family transporter n=1 Tax=uncultured Nocardioides sp. TaxID=198441 RepID=UPI00261898B8|nr:MMPL family transporter [uncultured Nocardioides sp.]
MASLLQRLGATAHRRWPAFIALWLVALIGVGAFAGFASKPLVDSFTIPGIESEEAADLQSELFGGGEDALEQATVNVVVQAPEGTTLADPDVNAEVTSLVADLQGLPQLSEADADPRSSAIVDPVLAAQGLEQQLREGYEQDPATAELPAEQVDALVEQNAAAVSPLSTDGRTGIISFVLDVPTPTEVESSTRDAITDVLDDARGSGLTAEANGQGMQALTDFGVTSEVVGIGVALLVLVLTFGSLVAAGLPILTALVGVGLGLLGVLGTTYFTELGTTTPILASMIGLAVGIDYALFILARYRSELDANGGDARRAIGRATGTAGSAVVFAGLTVVIALAALTVVGIPFLSAMGLAAAATVTIAVLVALTLLPAILGMVGSKAFGGRVRRYTPARDADGVVVNNGVRWARLVGKAPLVAIVLVVVALGALALPGRDLQLAFPSDSTAATDTTQRQASDLVEDAFGPGRESPLLVVVDARESDDPQAAYGRVVEWAGGQDDVANAQVVQVTEEGTGALVLLTPQSGPTALTTVDLLADLRAEQGDVESETGATLGVTGLTAIQVDTSEQLDEALPIYLAIVVGLAFLLLMVVFRSVLVPLTATLGFLLSVLATLGATVAVFQDGALGLVDGAPIISFLPVLVIGIVFGLAMDYQVFLVTRIREAHVHGADAREAVLDGFRNSARVVAAAAVIMISVFAAFVLQEDPIIKSMGFALAVAVAFDAFVVRMTLIPALMFLMKEKAWWLPRWLDRVLPTVDVEGDGLTDGPSAGGDDAGHKHRAAPTDRHPEPAHRA